MHDNYGMKFHKVNFTYNRICPCIDLIYTGCNSSYIINSCGFTKDSVINAEYCRVHHINFK